jgi:hypothetical protein
MENAQFPEMLAAAGGKGQGRIGLTARHHIAYTPGEPAEAIRNQ